MIIEDRARIVVFADGRDWQVRGLSAGFADAGIETVVVPLERVSFRTGAAGDPIRIPGFDEGLPRAAFVRSVSAGSFEAVTFRLGVLHGLVRAGVTVWNGPRAIEACVDKSMTTLLVARAGLATPETWVTEDPAKAAGIAAEASETAPLVLKPLFGAQGKGLRLLTRPEDLPAPEEVQGLYYLQRFVPSPNGAFQDYRVLVSAGRVVAAMRRHGTNWITNVHQGGRPEAWDPPSAAAEIAVAAVRAVGADFAGVDLVEDRAGRFLVLEVNSMPAWSGLQTVAARDIARTVAADLLAAAFGR